MPTDEVKCNCSGFRDLRLTVLKLSGVQLVMVYLCEDFQVSRILTESVRPVFSGACHQWVCKLNEVFASQSGRMVGILKTDLYSDESYNTIRASRNYRNSETNSWMLSSLGSAIKAFRGVRLEKTC